MNPLFGIPYIKSDLVPKGKMYLLNGSQIIFGTWVPPIRQSVSEIVAMQRRRRA